MQKRNGILKVKAGAGFTLLELIAVLAILAILLSWGLPSLSQSMRNNSVLAQSSDLIAMLHFAKSEALRRNTNVPIQLTSSSNGWAAMIDDPADAAIVAGCDAGELRCTSHSDAILTSSATITFNNRGYIRTDAEAWNSETLYVQHAQCEGNNQRRRINITPTGQIRSCALACDSTADC